LIASRSVQSPAVQAPSSWSVFLLTFKAPTIGVGVGAFSACVARPAPDQASIVKPILTVTCQ
jgi:hypothetical protein